MSNYERAIELQQILLNNNFNQKKLAILNRLFIKQIKALPPLNFLRFF